VIPSIVEFAAFGNCLAPYVAPTGGDEDSRDWRKLVKLLIQEHCSDKDSAMITMREIIGCARLNDLFVDVLWSLEAVLEELEAKKNFQWKKEMVEATDGSVTEGSGR